MPKSCFSFSSIRLNAKQPLTYILKSLPHLANHKKGSPQVSLIVGDNSLVFVLLWRWRDLLERRDFFASPLPRLPPSPPSPPLPHPRWLKVPKGNISPPQEGLLFWYLCLNSWLKKKKEEKGHIWASVLEGTVHHRGMVEFMAARVWLQSLRSQQRGDSGWNRCRTSPSDPLPTMKLHLEGLTNSPNSMTSWETGIQHMSLSGNSLRPNLKTSSNSHKFHF